MGLITRVIKSVESKVRALRYHGDANDMLHIQPLGDDSKPLPHDDALSTSCGSSYVIFGAFDESNKKAGAGEKRIYSRGSDGKVVAEVHLKSDGSILIKNDNYTHEAKADGEMTQTCGLASLKMEPDGSITINRLVTINAAGQITAPSIVASGSVSAPSMSIGGVEMAGHKHDKGTYQDSQYKPLTGGESGEAQ